MAQRNLLITGGAGFIGSSLVHAAVQTWGCRVVVLDKLTYAGNRDNLAALEGHPRYRFVHGDIADRDLVEKLLDECAIDAIMNLAAESHVDRSISGPRDFIHTNVAGTFELLEACRAHHSKLPAPRAASFRLLHVSTDEVFGSLGATGHFVETSPYRPSSPYAASKAAADHLVWAYFTTYGLPVLTTNCSNNYGPRQFPEKLIPLIMLNALEGKRLPVYGKGINVRDWLYVEDHCEALRAVLERGRPGQVYAVGGRCELTNIDLVRRICDILQELAPSARSYRDLIEFVVDRPGHDHRYAIDPTKIEQELGWKPHNTIEAGLRKTVAWYLENRVWCDRTSSGTYRRERLGLLPSSPPAVR